MPGGDGDNMDKSPSRPGEMGTELLLRRTKGTDDVAVREMGIEFPGNAGWGIFRRRSGRIIVCYWGPHGIYWNAIERAYPRSSTRGCRFPIIFPFEFSNCKPAASSSNIGFVQFHTPIVVDHITGVIHEIGHGAGDGILEVYGNIIPTEISHQIGVCRKLSRTDRSPNTFIVKRLPCIQTSRFTTIFRRAFHINYWC